MGVRSTIPLSDPRNQINHNALAPFLASVRDDPTLLFSSENVSFLAKQILQQFLSMMMHKDKEIDIMASPQQLGVDSLLGIKLRR